MNKIKTGNTSLDKWINFFYFSKKSNTKFIYLLKKSDKFFLTVSPTQNDEQVENEINIPDDGLLEEDFRKIAFYNTPDLVDEKARLVLAIMHNINYTPWINKYKEIFFDVIEKSLIDGNYEKYGIEFDKVIKVAIEKKYIPQEEFMGMAILRGMLFGERYESEEKEKKLKKEIKINKIKILLGL